MNDRLPSRTGPSAAREAARIFGRLFAFWAVLTLAAIAPAAAVEPLPTKEVAPGVFVYEAPFQLIAPSNEGAIANVGFVVGRDAVAVIDTGNSRIAGERLLAAVRARTALPIRYVVNTHMHPDHVLGDVAFRGEGATVVGHAKLARALQARSQTYLDAGKRLLGASFDGTEVVLPQTSITEPTTLDLGGRALKLEPWPTAHTDNDLTVLDEATGTWFLGDLVFLGHLPSIDGSLEGWVKVMGTLATRPAARIVPGHGPAFASWPEALDPQRRYFDRLRTDVEALMASGATLREASEKAGLAERDAWALFDEFNSRNAIEAYREQEWR
ncbi:quinoprotein relay system zinc metallohydrolase 2 [Methylopila capsulata]|uniref:MBL fold metallo-hydrolase n=1 Tax=Methylopila capsulata TaxID=61654 RepID=A0A9W6IU07_9HYPH|nr:quinoprotein relay system zinc metallohydrolase 2 [Methylopila capsulata]MBM7850068.1 quinoprotein relay system zinc metallohydrolase 2 [Methylopila capsulata]GLK55359.1 MBL fold metallo-hydrolase [Methylopila capsulata]